MAEDKKDKKKDSKKPKSSGGGMSFGVEVIIFVVFIFIIWMLTGGNKKEVQGGPFINPSNITPTTPTEGYN